MWARFARLVAVATVCLVSWPWGVRADGATYYLFPTGTDGNPGTSAAPWQTFARAIPKLRAGDTLLLRNGTYTGSKSGYANIVCGSNAVNGTASQPITIKAENERQAFIQGDGSVTPFAMYNCSYWTVQGLRVENTDNANQTGDTDGVMIFKGSDHLSIKRNLVRISNRHMNQHGIMYSGTNSLLEENELYSIKRHGILLSLASNNIIRRNYANSRGYCDLRGCDRRGCSVNCAKGDSAFTMYTGKINSNNIFENNISEGNGTGIYFNAHYTINDGNRTYGNISLNDDYGIMTEEGVDSSAVVKNALVQDEVIVNPLKIGFYVGNHSITVNRMTILNTSGNYGAGTGLLVTKGVNPQIGSGNYSFTGTNILVSNSASTGFRVDPSIQSWSLTKINSYNNRPNYSAPSSGQCANCSNQRSTNPQLGACSVFVPATSPMHRAGSGGVDIGANALYQYVKGSLTSTPLWLAASGYRFSGCGATVAGVNDQAGTSCFDVQKRLNVNANGCSLPANYGQ
jgi:parallel beta-helix repeat protein